MSRLWITGYRSYELGTFGKNDPKIKVIKYALERSIELQLENGLEWLITGGQLGIEQWAVEVALEFKTKWPMLKIAVMLPFKDFGKQWQPENYNQLNQLILAVDFCDTVSHEKYMGPIQLKNYQNFMIEHTDSAMLVYDPEFEGKSQYDFQLIKQQQEKRPYPLTLIDMNQLQEYGVEYNDIMESEDMFSE